MSFILEVFYTSYYYIVDFLTFACKFESVTRRFSVLVPGVSMLERCAGAAFVDRMMVCRRDCRMRASCRQRHAMGRLWCDGDRSVALWRVTVRPHVRNMGTISAGPCIAYVERIAECSSGAGESAVFLAALERNGWAHIEQSACVPR